MFDKRKRKNQGFTLIELLIVIAIIGLIATLSILALNKARSYARDARRMADIKQLHTAIELYYNQYNYYPQFIGLSYRCNIGLSNSLSQLVNSGLMLNAPTDPWNYTSQSPRFCYEYIGIGNASSYNPAVSTWYCDGKPRSDYEWSLMFSLEANNAKYSRLTNNVGTPLTDYKYCVHGSIRPSLLE